MNRILWTAIIFVVMFFLGDQIYGSYRDNVFKKHAAPGITMVVADPTKLCDDKTVFATPDGYYAKCLATGIDRPTSIYSVVVTFYVKANDATADPPRERGKAFLMFNKPHLLTNTAFRRPNGDDID